MITCEVKCLVCIFLKIAAYDGKSSYVRLIWYLEAQSVSVISLIFTVCVNKMILDAVVNGICHKFFPSQS
jgi:hypothetical protein